MSENIQVYSLVTAEDDTTKYPMFTMALAVLLLFAAPFTTTWLAAVAFVICVYRVVRYEARVFAVDYCILMPIAALMKLDNGLPLAIYLSLIAGIWYLVRGGFRANAAYVLLLVFLNYLILRMQMNVNSLVLCFGHIFVLLVLIPQQDSESAERAIKAFCISLLVSSVYAYLLRNTSALSEITGAASTPMWGTNLKRFEGLIADPNYYMSMLVGGIALLLKLKDSGRIRNFAFWIQIVGMTFWGILTYSKTFFLMFILLIGVYVIWQYWNKKVLKGMLVTMLAVAALFLIFTMENSPFAVVLNRLTGAQSLSELTTSRTDLYLLYWQEISANWGNFLFGKGMAAEALYRDPHNIYLELGYYIGIVGALLFFALHISILRMTLRMVTDAPKQNFIAKYMVLGTVLIIYFSLQGIFMQIMHAEIFLAFLSILLTRKQ